MPDNLHQLWLQMIKEIVEATPNDMELGKKIREFYYKNLKK